MYSNINVTNFIKKLQSYSDGTITEKEMTKAISDAFINDRLELFKLIGSLLKKNGKFFLSDPDGFSDWNANQIYGNDWSHAVAHFSNIKLDLELIEKNIPSLKFSKAYIQVKDKMQKIISIPLSRDEIVKCSFLPKIKKYYDWHLGYIIGFEKIK